jgi:mono/diheme cytochrome c family protein
VARGREFWLGALAVFSLACSRSGPGATQGAAQRGATVYANVCTTCHAADPKLDGSIGPAVAGASRELLEARLMRGGYPPGYTPKRPSHAMPPYPYLEQQIDDLAAYLAEATRR